MSNPLANQPPAQYLSSRQLIAGSDFNNVTSQLNSVESGITAHSGGTKAAAYQLKAATNLVTVSAADTDSVMLPVGFDGLEVIIINADAAQDIQVFGNGTDTINDIATATGIAQGQRTMGIYKCAVGRTAAVPAAQWFAVHIALAT